MMGNPMTLQQGGDLRARLNELRQMRVLLIGPASRHQFDKCFGAVLEALASSSSQEARCSHRWDTYGHDGADPTKDINWCELCGALRLGDGSIRTPDAGPQATSPVREHVERARRITAKFAPGEHGLTNQLVREFDEVAASSVAPERGGALRELVEKFYRDQGDGIDGRLYRCKACNKGWSVGGTFSSGPQHFVDCPVADLAALALPEPMDER